MKPAARSGRLRLVRLLIDTGKLLVEYAGQPFLAAAAITADARGSFEETHAVATRPNELADLGFGEPFAVAHDHETPDGSASIGSSDRRAAASTHTCGVVGSAPEWTRDRGRRKHVTARGKHRTAGSGSARMPPE
jgi:hypothetical protein